MKLNFPVSRISQNPSEKYHFELGREFSRSTVSISNVVRLRNVEDDRRAQPPVPCAAKEVAHSLEAASQSIPVSLPPSPVVRGRLTRASNASRYLGPGHHDSRREGTTRAARPSETKALSSPSNLPHPLRPM